MNPSIAEKVREVIIQCSPRAITEEELTENTDLIEALGFDSMVIVSLVVELEKAFQIEINEIYLEPEIIGHFKALVECIEMQLESVYEDQ